MERALFSPRARIDLLETWAYLAQYSPETADAWVARVLETADVLATFPYLGRVRAELVGAPRSIAIESFVLFYDVNPTSIRVLRVLHGSRDIPTLFLDNA
jgi:toxin ParE1/3/4